MPLPERGLSCALVRSGRALTLIDCGEGTQVAMRRCGWGFRHLNTILITHLHADHILGLPGLLTTLAFTGKRESEPLTIYGPAPVVEVVQALMVVAPRLPYPVRVETLEGGETFKLEESGGMRASCAWAEHRAPCLAYSLEIPRAPKFRPERAEELGLPVQLWSTLQRGESVSFEGRERRPEEVLGPARRGLRLVYITDTRFTESLVEFTRADGQGADLLICDGTYGDEEQRSEDQEPQHLTFAEAATLARRGGARKLWLTHFSMKMPDPNAYLDRATAVFPNTTVGHDGLTDTLNFDP